MKEQLISEETSKLAEEKGFKRYEVQEPIIIPVSEIYDSGTSDNEFTYFTGVTLSLLQQWLREVHNLILIIHYIYEFDSTPYTFFIIRKDESSPVNEWKKDFSTYEEALEYGIQEALKLIKS